MRQAETWHWWVYGSKKEVYTANSVTSDFFGCLGLVHYSEVYVNTYTDILWVWAPRCWYQCIIEATWCDVGLSESWPPVQQTIIIYHYLPFQICRKIRINLQLASFAMETRGLKLVFQEIGKVCIFCCISDLLLGEGGPSTSGIYWLVSESWLMNHWLIQT